MDNITAATIKTRIANARNLVVAVAPSNGGAKETKILSEIINILEAIVDSANDLHDNVENLAEYTESLHTTLCDFEESIFCSSPTEGACEDCSCEGAICHNSVVGDQ